MRVGNLSGRDVVYRVLRKEDYHGLTSICSGDIMLTAGEELKAVLPDQRISLHHGWHSWSSDKGFSTPDGRMVLFYSNDGPGSLYVTDARTVFLRRPEPKEIRRNHSGHEQSAVLPLENARRIMMANALEFCEIRHEDVVRYKEKRWGLVTYLDCDRQKFYFSVSKEAADVLLPMLRNRLPYS